MQGPGWVYNRLTGKLGDFRSQLGRKKPEKRQTPALLCLRPDREIRRLVRLLFLRLWQRWGAG